MVTTIRVSCPTEGCGEQRITSNDVVLRMLRGDDKGTYLFVCPQCHETVVKDASVHIVDLLIGADVKVVVWTLPDELSDPHRRSESSVVSLDDVLEIHEALDRDDFIDRLTWGEQ